MPNNFWAKWAMMGIICGIACDVESEDVPLEAEQAIEPAEQVEEDEFRASWECVLKPESSKTYGVVLEKGELYCLVKCKGYEYTRASKKPVLLEEVTDKYCENRAEKFCEQYGRDYDEWCWGDRADDDDD